MQHYLHFALNERGLVENHRKSQTLVLTMNILSTTTDVNTFEKGVQRPCYWVYLTALILFGIEKNLWEFILESTSNVRVRLFLLFSA